MYWVKLNGNGGEKLFLAPIWGGGGEGGREDYTQQKPNIIPATHKHNSDPVTTLYIKA